jgi:hypothetical protein
VRPPQASIPISQEPNGMSCVTGFGWYYSTPRPTRALTVAAQGYPGKGHALGSALSVVASLQQVGD